MAALINNNITNDGLLLLAKGTAGKAIKFTKIVLGDGQLEDDVDIRTMTELVHPKVNVDISEIKLGKDYTVYVSGIFSSKDLEETFYYRELGLFAEDPDTNEEILYCYGNAGENAEIIPPTGGSTAIEKQVSVITVVGRATNVYAVISPDAYATKGDYEELLKRVEACEKLVSECNDKSTEAIEKADYAVSLAEDLYRKVSINTNRINVLWNLNFAKVAGHPWTLDLSKMDNIVLASGCYNEALGRVEV